MSEPAYLKRIIRKELMMNAFTQDDFKGAYKSASLQQIRSLADHGHAEARELLALELSDEQVNVRSAGSSQPKNSLLHRIGTFMNKWCEYSYQAWVKAGRPDNF